jgi:hypothetical protein
MNVIDSLKPHESQRVIDLVAAAGKLDVSLAKVAAKSRDESASHLTPADQYRVQQKVRKWFEAHQAKP